MSSFSPLSPPNVTYAGTKPLFLNANDITGDNQYTKALTMGNSVAVVFQPLSAPINSRSGICGVTQLTPIDSLFDIEVPGMTPTGVALVTYYNSGVPIDPFAPLENTITTVTCGVNKITIFIGIRGINPGDSLAWFCPRLSVS
jgi:hypothetical protein